MKPSFDWGQELPRLRGRRVDLTWLTEKDSPAIFTIFGDPEVMRFWSSPPLASLDSAVDLIKDIHRLFGSRRLFQWGIGLRETEEMTRS